MLSKWFIGVSAKSKGFFTGFQYVRTDSMPKPSFTKQTALARSFTSKAEAEEHLTGLIYDQSYNLATDLNKLDTIDKVSPIWNNKTQDEKIKLLIACDIPIRFPSNDWRGKTSISSLNLKYHTRSNNTRPLSDVQIAGLDTVDWELEKTRINSTIDIHSNKIDFLNNKISIREQDLELKFMDRERRKVEWVNRGEDETSNRYCNCCGGAVPNIPQLVIGSSWGKNSTTICAICMARLADEAKTQAGKIPDEILEHYNTDRFLRCMD